MNTKVYTSIEYVGTSIPGILVGYTSHRVWVINIKYLVTGTIYILYECISRWKWLSFTCKLSWSTTRAAYWEVVIRGACVCVLYIKPFFLLVHI